MESLEGPPVSSPDPAIIDSVEQPASSSTRAVTDMPFIGSPTVPTHTLHCLTMLYAASQCCHTACKCNAVSLNSTLARSLYLMDTIERVV